MEKASIVFLPVPPSLKSEMRKLSQGLKVDPGIPLPLEIPEDGKNTFDPEKISWEMIISGMLRIISAKGGNNTSMISAKDGNHTSIISDSREDVPAEWIDYYRRFVLAVKPEIYHEFTSASIIKARNGEFDMALEINAVLEGLFPGSPGILLNKALILEDRAAALEKSGHEAGTENAEAERAYETAMSLEPVLPDTLFNAGFFFMRVRNYIQARECFSRYVKAGERTEIPANKKKQAQKIIKDLASLADTGFQEAYDCISRGDNETGLVKVREFIEKYPMVWNGWFLLGWTLRKLGRYGDGIESLKKALELGGANCDIQNEMAICLMELGDLKGAKKELEHAIREEPENIKIISNLGVLALKAGNRNEAAAFFRTVLEINPDDTLAKHFLEEI